MICDFLLSFSRRGAKRASPAPTAASEPRPHRNNDPLAASDLARKTQSGASK
jgi:hypothetical protein